MSKLDLLRNLGVFAARNKKRIAIGGTVVGGVALANANKQQQTTPQEDNTATQEDVVKAVDQPTSLDYSAAHVTTPVTMPIQSSEPNAIFKDQENERLARELGVFIANPDRKEGETPVYKNYAPSKELLTSPAKYDEAVKLLQRDSETAVGDVYRKRAYAEADLAKTQAYIDKRKQDTFNHLTQSDQQYQGILAAIDAAKVKLMNGDAKAATELAMLERSKQQLDLRYQQQAELSIGQDVNLQRKLALANERVKQSNLDISLHQNELQSQVSKDIKDKKLAKNKLVTTVAKITGSDLESAALLVKDKSTHDLPQVRVAAIATASPNGIPDATSVLFETGLHGVIPATRLVINRFVEAGMDTTASNLLGDAYGNALVAAKTTAEQTAQERATTEFQAILKTYQDKGQKPPLSTLNKIKEKVFTDNYQRYLRIAVQESLKKAGMAYLTNAVVTGKPLHKLKPAQLLAILNNLQSEFARLPLRDVFGLTAREAELNLRSAWANAQANKGI